MVWTVFRPRVFDPEVMTMKIAGPDDWKTHPLPECRAVVEVDQRYGDDEMSRIRRGLIPEVMEDKWFAYWADDRLHFHRSWTGICVYIVHFESDERGGRAVRVEVNADPEQWRDPVPGEEGPLALSLIEMLLLGCPLRPSVETEEEALQLWQLIGRASLGEGPSGDERD